MPSRLKPLLGEKKYPKLTQSMILITCGNWNGIKKTRSTGLVRFHPKGENRFSVRKTRWFL